MRSVAGPGTVPRARQNVAGTSDLPRKLDRCGAGALFQIMEAEDAVALQPWLDAWADIVDFEVVPVLASADYWTSLEDVRR
jgi:Protein of unknown function (DUF3303)